MACFEVNCTKFDFGWGSVPDPAGELTVIPNPIDGFHAPFGKFLHA